MKTFELGHWALKTETVYYKLLVANSFCYYKISTIYYVCNICYMQWQIFLRALLLNLIIYLIVLANE